MRIRDKKSFAEGLIQVSAVLLGYVHYSNSLKDAFPWLILGLISAAALHSFWHAFNRSANQGPWKDYLSRAVLLLLAGIMLSVLSIVSHLFSKEEIALVALVLAMACVDFVFWFNHRNDPTTL